MDERLSAIIHELEYFNKGLIWTNPPALGADIAAAEEALNWKFSPMMKEFYAFSNGLEILEYLILCVQITGTRKIPKNYDIAFINLDLREKTWWPKNWLNIGEDWYGNYFVAIAHDPNQTETARCYWVDHDWLGLPNIKPVYLGSFYGFLEYIVRNLRRNYAPDGKSIVQE